MKHYEIDFECFWDDRYPVPHTCGTFFLDKSDDLEVIYEIKRRFL